MSLPSQPKDAIPLARDANLVLQLRRQEEKELRRQSILDAAEKVIAAVGWEATNFSEIAKECRLSRSLIYVYFPTKTDLFHAICNRGAGILGELFAQAMSQGKGGLDQIETIGHAYFQFARKYPVYFKLHAEQQVEESPAGEASSVASPPPSFSHPAFLLLYQALERGVADGSIRADRLGDIKATAVSLWAFTHGLLLIATRKEDFFRERMGMDSRDLVSHGFRLMRGMLEGDKDRS